MAASYASRAQSILCKLHVLSNNVWYSWTCGRVDVPRLRILVEYRTEIQVRHKFKRKNKRAATAMNSETQFTLQASCYEQNNLKILVESQAHNYSSSVRFRSYPSRKNRFEVMLGNHVANWVRFVPCSRVYTGPGFEI